MKSKTLISAMLVAMVCCPKAGAGEPYVLKNRFLTRVISTQGDVLRTVRIINQRSGATLVPSASPEFRIRVSQGTDRPETAVTLGASDFRVVKATVSETGAVQELTFRLENKAHQLDVDVHYELAADDFFMRKRLVIATGRPTVLERIDVEALAIGDAYQPYTDREITARAAARWNPGLGQPLYTSNSATFWGIEFPAADNQVRDGSLTAGYLHGNGLQPGKPYSTYAAVMGVADDPARVTENFFEYINRIRVRPLRLQIQYNSWFDSGSAVSREKFAASVERINRELVRKRGLHPLGAYVIDDGWEDVQADWSDKVWKVNQKFDSDFASTRKVVAAAKSRLGLWMSPGCLFNSHAQVAKLRGQGFEALDDWMSMAGPRYMQALEDRMVELTRLGVHFYKLDGLFGHLNFRNFDLAGGKYGVPTMPQLGLDGFTSGDVRLNDSRYDELKIYYLTAGTERLIRIFQKLGTIDPDIYIVLSNGAYLSPWWLMSVDTIWMINASDSAAGSGRTEQLVYRDDQYYEIWRRQHIQFPMCSVFNHEPKKIAADESSEAFRQYLYLCLSRGTGFLELYLKPSVLRDGDWDTLADGVQWATEMFPTFIRVRMHGGKPGAGEVYGYTAWNQNQGYISLHNPSDQTRKYVLRLDREFGLVSNSGPFYLSSPLKGSLQGLPASCAFGDSLTFELAPKEIRVVDFNTKRADGRTQRTVSTGE